MKRAESGNLKARPGQTEPGPLGEGARRGQSRHGLIREEPDHTKGGRKGQDSPDSCHLSLRCLPLFQNQPNRTNPKH